MRKTDLEGHSETEAPLLGSDVNQQAETVRTMQPPVDIQAYIGSRLREVYDDVAKQPVPSRFLELMRLLEDK